MCSVDEPTLDDDLLRALRNKREQSVDQLAEAVGLPRTNFGRAPRRRVRERVRHLVDQGLIEEHGKRYRISEHGRRVLAERTLE
jgi:DNA-binding Lrp family transcriptional regulator